MPFASYRTDHALVPTAQTVQGPCIRETIVCANQLQNSRSVLYKIVNTNEGYSDTFVIQHSIAL